MRDGRATHGQRFLQPSPAAADNESVEGEGRQLARIAGLRDIDAPRLEDVHRRRSQLWLLSLLVGLAVPSFIVALGYEVMPAWVEAALDLHTVRLTLLGLLVVVFGYVAERERVLRRLTGLLIEERVLTASLVSRVDELDLLLEATRAMNSTLEIATVLDVILRSAYDLLGAGEGSIQLVDLEHPGMLEVAVVRGASPSRVGQRQPIGGGIAGAVAAHRDALLLGDRTAAAASNRSIGSALLVPLEVRGRLVGVLNLSAGERRAPFTAFELRSVAVFAEAAAAAIVNARRHAITEGRVADLTELDQLKDEFLALISHELRTPLTSMIGLLQTIERGAERLRPDRIQDMAGTARHEGWRLNRLVDDLLHASQARNGTLPLRGSHSDVSTILSRTVGALRTTAGAHVLDVVVPTDPLERWVDSDAVSRIVTNLVANAVKYTADGSRVVVSAAPWGDGLSLTVTDDGPGIPDSQREAVFVKFQRGEDRRRAGGLGLGLFIVRALAEAHGGRAEVRASQSGGAQFVVHLGSLQPPAEPDEECHSLRGGSVSSTS
ncbi:MAG: ATP-binding protein [Actinomycetota bacterium]|jgi:signal transduction histidine kinase|nr:ATP-binding protein [Actinomycetota bacterium]